MTVLPAYVNSVFLLAIASFISLTHYPIQKAKQYMADVTAMIACHEALVQYADHPGTVSSSTPVAASAIDPYLPPGVDACDGYPFIYVFASPGTAVTYLNTTGLSANTVSLVWNTVDQVVQKFSASAATLLTVGPTASDGAGGTEIVPQLPASPVETLPSVPVNTFALQSIIASH